AERVAPSGVHLTPPPWARTSPARPKSAETDFSSRGTRPFPLAARSGHCPTRRHLQEAGAGSASNAAVEERPFRPRPLSEGVPISKIAFSNWAVPEYDVSSSPALIL